MWMPGHRKAGLICAPRIWLCGKSVLRRWRGADRIFAGVDRRLLLLRGISMTTFALARLWAGSLITSKMGTGLSMGIGLSEEARARPYYTRSNGFAGSSIEVRSCLLFGNDFR